MRKRASLKDIYRLYQVVVSVPKVVRLLEDLGSATVQNVIINPMKDALNVSILFYS